jgi:hypothetical protein
VANNPVSLVDPFGLELGDWWDPRSYFNSGFVEGYQDAAVRIGGNVHDTFAGIGQLGGNLSTEYGRAQYADLIKRLGPLIKRLYEDKCFRELAKNKLGAGIDAWLERLKTAEGQGDLLASAGLELLATVGTAGLSKLKYIDELESILRGLDKIIPDVSTQKLGKGGIPLQTGAGDLFGGADEAYDAIRASTTDVAEIAEKTGLKASNIQKVKDHVFMDEHLLDLYVDYDVPAVTSKFDSSSAIAEAWERLRTGTHQPADIALLKHEIAEAWFMKKHGPSYKAAHEKAQKLFPSGL